MLSATLRRSAGTSPCAMSWLDQSAEFRDPVVPPCTGLPWEYVRVRLWDGSAAEFLIQPRYEPCKLCAFKNRQASERVLQSVSGVFRIAAWTSRVGKVEMSAGLPDETFVLGERADDCAGPETLLLYASDGGTGPARQCRDLGSWAVAPPIDPEPRT